MTTPEILSVLMLVTVCVTMMFGFPVAFTLSGVAVLFAFGGAAIGEFDMFFYCLLYTSPSPRD